MSLARIAGNEPDYLFEVQGMPEKSLRVISFYGTEGISELFHFQIELISLDSGIDFAKVMGTPAKLTIRGPAQDRNVHGMVTQFNQLGKKGKYTHYYAEISPIIWDLMLMQSLQIHQNKSIDEILEFVLVNQGGLQKGKNLRFELKKDQYKKLEFVVQYRESFFSFISRWMEHYGIFYYFEHTDSDHVMVVTDDSSKLSDIPGDSTVIYNDGSTGTTATANQEFISNYEIQTSTRSDSIRLRDFDFHKPGLDLKTDAEADDARVPLPRFIYDYPGGYFKKEEGKLLVNIRLDEQRCQVHQGRGQSNCRRMMAGYRFSLDQHSRKDCNRKYLLTRIICSGTQSQELEAEAGGAGEGTTYYNQFECIPADKSFRPKRVTQKPMVSGIQTAIVVGPPGEAIHTDNYGRVKVRFHWDLEAKGDDKSSCWIRVSQSWGGGNWGAVFLPHVGQEVIVDFEEGDPDRPIITGRVYNGTHMPPLGLPGEKTKSIIRDYGNNEISMEGNQGKESIHTKQACGNEFLMDGTQGQEKIEMRDKYGNEIVLDAVNGIIRIYSPTHESQIVLGRSLEFWSLSDYKINIGGKEQKVLDGSKHENILGASSKLIGGVKHETVIGSEVKVNLVQKTEIGKAQRIKGTWGNEIELNKAKQSKKAPSLRELIDDHQSWVKSEKIKAEKMRVEAEKLYQGGRQHVIASQELTGDGKKLRFNYAESVWKLSDKLKTEANEIEATANSTYKVLAEMIKLG